MNTFDKYLREDQKTDTTSKMKYNSLNITLGLFFVHTFPFVALLLEKACKFCRAKLQNQPNKNIGDEHGSFVVNLLRSNTTTHKLYELSAKVNFVLSIGVAVAVNFFLQLIFIFSFVLNSLSYITIPKNKEKVKIN